MPHKIYIKLKITNTWDLHRPTTGRRIQPVLFENMPGPHKVQLVIPDIQLNSGHMNNSNTCWYMQTRQSDSNQIIKNNANMICKKIEMKAAVLFANKVLKVEYQ
jgi:hypothetical protein